MSAVLRRFSRTKPHMLRHELAIRGWTESVAAEKTGLHIWTISRAVNGHPIRLSTLQKIAEALAAAPVIDRGLLAAPGQLEDA